MWCSLALRQEAQVAGKDKEEAPPNGASAGVLEWRLSGHVAFLSAIIQKYQWESYELLDVRKYLYKRGKIHRKAEQQDLDDRPVPTKC